MPVLQGDLVQKQHEREAKVGEPGRPQNLFEQIIAALFFIPTFIAVAICTVVLAVFSPVIWLVEGRHGKTKPPNVAAPRSMHTRPIPASDADARSLLIQDEIEAS